MRDPEVYVHLFHTRAEGHRLGFNPPFMMAIDL